MNLVPVFRIEPGDGTGNSLADAKARNAKGLCAVINCGKPLSAECTWRFGQLCSACDAQWKQSLNTLIINAFAEI